MIYLHLWALALNVHLYRRQLSWISEPGFALFFSSRAILLQNMTCSVNSLVQKGRYRGQSLDTVAVIPGQCSWELCLELCTRRPSKGFGTCLGSLSCTGALVSRSWVEKH